MLLFFIFGLCRSIKLKGNSCYLVCSSGSVICIFSSQVARQLNVQIERDNIHLPLPLRTFGEHEVQLRLPKSIPLPEGKVNWTLTVKIRGK